MLNCSIVSSLCCSKHTAGIATWGTDMSLDKIRIFIAPCIKFGLTWYSTRRILVCLEWPCAFHFLSVLESKSELFSLHPLEFKRVRFAETSSPYGTIGLSVYYKPSITLPDRSVIDTSNHHTQYLYVSRRPSKIGFAVLLMDLLRAIQCVCSVKKCLQHCIAWDSSLGVEILQKVRGNCVHSKIAHSQISMLNIKSLTQE